MTVDAFFAALESEGLTFTICSSDPDDVWQPVRDSENRCPLTALAHRRHGFASITDWWGAALVLGLSARDAMVIRVASDETWQPLRARIPGDAARLKAALTGAGGYDAWAKAMGLRRPSARGAA